ncbi:28S ribosomal protein S33, mitochondrial-like [Mytilus californianus]|uniref:28S ribosomal protein S33, mitochondrial-like n=1 Tax=Mytilus californianus TaxID=6549 RepID=UPI0022482EB3|nr:28S ribosomal protein S33, mitochondrial-like [Mytilus californianus]
MSGSRYAARMARLSAKIFGEVSPTDTKLSRKVVDLMSKPYYHEQPEVVNYYPKHFEVTRLMKTLRHFGLFRSEHLDFTEEMERLRKLRGKGKPTRDARKRKKEE